MNSITNVNMDGQELEITMMAYDLLIEKAARENDILLYKYSSRLKRRLYKKKKEHHRVWGEYFRQRMLNNS